jgi:UDP-N-acetylglucosamine:LPS N-acetylglucosamine transferase
MEWHESKKPPLPENQGLTLLILTARVAGGHESLAQALKAALEAEGHHVIVDDGLRAASPILALVTQWGYWLQLRLLPWTIHPLFAVKTHPRVAPRLRRWYGVAYSKRLHHAIRQVRPHAVVSTYPVLTAMLDRLRATGDLHIPVITVIADYGVHPLWIGPATDLHIVSNDVSRQLIERDGGRAMIARIPVDARFMQPPPRDEVRKRFGLPTGRKIVLITGGAWGVGELDVPVRWAIEAGAYPVVVTGHNRSLRTRLLQRYPDPATACILGWTPDMPALMRAADCLVQNAGGMTCHEAAAVGLPLYFARPLPGHGRLNAALMEAAGAARCLHSSEDLANALRGEQARRPALQSGKMPPASALIAELAARNGGSPWPSPLYRPYRTAPRRLRLATMAAALLMLVWLSLTPWTNGLAALISPPTVTARQLPPGTVSLVVHVTDPETARVVEDLIEQEHLPIAIFVTDRALPGIHVNENVVLGVAVDDSLTSLAHPWRERHRAQQAARELRQQMGRDAVFVLPPVRGRSLLSTALVPDHGLIVDAHPPRHGRDDPGILVLDLAGQSPGSATALIHDELQHLSEEGWQCVPLPFSQ